MSQENNNAAPTSLGDVSGAMYAPANTQQQYTGVAEPQYEISQNEDSQPDVAMIVISISVILFIFLLFKPCRDFAVWVIKDIMIPALTWFFQISSLWMVWLFKNIVTSHIDFTKHLMSPRNLIYFNLDDQREENDKSINRKVE